MSDETAGVTEVVTDMAEVVSTEIVDVIEPTIIMEAEPVVNAAEIQVAKDQRTKEQIELAKQVNDGAKILIAVFAFVAAILAYNTFSIAGLVAAGIVMVFLYWWNDIVVMFTPSKPVGTE